jgi:uncharacterized protein (TIGR04552 family)
MSKKNAPELYHEIFGSILDRTEMRPYLLLGAESYRVAMRQATRMLGNRGFDTLGSEDLRPGEQERAQRYAHEARRYLVDWLLPFVRRQLVKLRALGSRNQPLYVEGLAAVSSFVATLRDSRFGRLVEEDPRHLFLLASSRRYPDLFHGYHGGGLSVPPTWQHMACALLKMGHLVKSIEEDSQDIHDVAELAIQLQVRGYGLDDLFDFDWDNPQWLPDVEAAQRAYVKVATFFHRLRASMGVSPERGCLVFSSGDGVDVDIVEVKARLKSPESMFTKLGMSLEGEAYDIRDVLAITFVLRSREDTMTLFHALQKQGVILQENTVSSSIQQTLFDSPADMLEAVRRLTVNLARSEGRRPELDRRELRREARQSFAALRGRRVANQDSAREHRKFQCKINFSLPIHRDARSKRILVPGTSAYARRDSRRLITEQHTLAVELRIADEKSWCESELSGQAHHDAYRFRQLVALMNRLFRPRFAFPASAMAGLRADQDRVFAGEPTTRGRRR